MVKKILSAIFGVMLIGGVAFAGQEGSRKLVTSTGVLTADGAIKTTSGIVYSVTGACDGGAALVYLCDGTNADTDTVSKQLIAVGGSAANVGLNWSCSNGVKFSSGIYLREKTGNAVVTVIYE